MADSRGAEKPAETSCSQVQRCQPSALHRALMWQVTKRNRLIWFNSITSTSRQTALNKVCLWVPTSLSCPYGLSAYFPYGVFMTLELLVCFMLASETETREHCTHFISFFFQRLRFNLLVQLMLWGSLCMFGTGVCPKHEVISDQKLLVLSLIL